MSTTVAFTPAAAYRPVSAPKTRTQAGKIRSQAFVRGDGSKAFMTGGVPVLPKVGFPSKVCELAVGLIRMYLMHVSLHSMCPHRSMSEFARNRPLLGCSIVTEGKALCLAGSVHAEVWRVSSGD